MIAIYFLAHVEDAFQRRTLTTAPTYQSGGSRTNETLFFLDLGIHCWLWQDLATQIWHSKPYTLSCKQMNQKKGKYLALPFAEHLSGSCFVVQYLVASCLLAGLPEGWSSPDALVTQKHVSRVCPWVDKPVTLLDFQQAKQLTCYVCSSTLMGCSASWLFLDLEYLQFGASGC